MQESREPSAEELDATVAKRVRLRYLRWLPQGYGDGRQWPLLLFLHGSGERGDDLALVRRAGLPPVLARRPDLPFVVIAPQCTLQSDWELEGDALLALLDEVMARHAIDPRRVYLTGLSMGGRGTWALASLAPQRFAAIAPICGRRPNWLRTTERVAPLKGVPAWVFHGARDQVAPVSESEEMVAALRSHGAEVRLTIYPEADHDSWTAAYATAELYDWLLAHEREPA